MTAEKILDLARGELGVTELPPSSNNVKYNTAYYDREVAGSYPWCAVFVWWVFRQAGASDLYYGGQKTAYCPTLLSYHKGLEQGIHGNYRPGDIVFFNFSGGRGASHVGICESWDGTNITTIDGNTGTASQDNGGAVLRQTRNKRYIVGAYRPAYEEVRELTEEQVREIVRDEWARMEAERAALPASEGWSRMDRARELGITDGTRPQSFATREEVATMLVNERGS